MPISNQDLRKAGLKVTLPRIKILELLENITSVNLESTRAVAVTIPAPLLINIVPLLLILPALMSLPFGVTFP